MLPLYWHDIEDSKGTWYALQLTIQETMAAKPPVQFRSSHNGQVRLTKLGETLFWVSIGEDYSGVWVIQNWSEDSQYTPCHNIVPPITSQEIQQYAHLTTQDYFKQWSRFFVKKLQKSEQHFLYSGDWLLQGLYPDAQKSSSEYPEQGLPRYYLTKKDCINIFGSNHSVTWKSWWDYRTEPKTEDSILIKTKKIDIESGRLKWWRKKAKEQSLPPILLWYVSCVDAYLIVDGHYRLMAANLEQCLPSFIVISSVKEIALHRDPLVQQQIIDSL